MLNWGSWAKTLKIAVCIQHFLHNAPSKIYQDL